MKFARQIIQINTMVREDFGNAMCFCGKYELGFGKL